MSFINSRILITGGTGFVGKNLTKYLQEKGYDKVVSIGSKDYDLRKATDVDYCLSYHQPSVIIHLAATVGGIGANRADPAKFMYDNLSMGLNLIERSRAYGKLRKFINLSTVCSYPCDTKVPFKEEDLWLGYPEVTNAPYGIAKKTLVELLIQYKKQYDFPCVNLIPTNLFGPYDNIDLRSSHIIPAVIRKFLDVEKEGRGSVEFWGNGLATRDFLYVSDLCRAIHLVLKQDYDGASPLNIGSGREVCIREIVYMVRGYLNSKVEIKWDSSYPNGQPRRCLNIGLAKGLLDWEPRITVEQGVLETIKDIRGRLE